MLRESSRCLVLNRLNVHKLSHKFQVGTWSRRLTVDMRVMVDFQISERSDFGVCNRSCFEVLFVCLGVHVSNSWAWEVLLLTKLSFLAKAAYRNSQEAREMAVQLVVAGTTFDIPGENLSWRNGEMEKLLWQHSKQPMIDRRTFTNFEGCRAINIKHRSVFLKSAWCIYTGIAVWKYNCSVPPWGRDVNLIRPRQLVEGFWLRKVSDVYDMADGPVAGRGGTRISMDFCGDSVYSARFLEKWCEGYWYWNRMKSVVASVSNQPIK